MKAFIVDRYKSKDGLRFGDMPGPPVKLLRHRDWSFGLFFPASSAS